jgi:sulfatase modifying factor 1
MVSNGLDSMATQTASTKQVFISHATQDADFAHRLADSLKQLGVPVWIAPDSILPGENWVVAIDRGLGESSHMLIVLTPAAAESPWVKTETSVGIGLAHQGRMKIIPLDVQACDVPLLLGSYQRVSFRRDYAAGFTKLTGVLGLSAPPPKAQAKPRAALARHQPLEPEMVLIPAGEFLMGSDPNKEKYAARHE